MLLGSPVERARLMVRYQCNFQPTAQITHKAMRPELRVKQMAKQKKAWRGSVQVTLDLSVRLPDSAYNDLPSQVGERPVVGRKTQVQSCSQALSPLSWQGVH